MLKDWTKELRFSPPYGDGTKSDCDDKQIYKFSPPCGDGTNEAHFNQIPQTFSPPYGDGTLDAEKARLSTVVFAPLRG